MTRHLLLILVAILALTTRAQLIPVTQPTSRPAWTLLFPGTHRYYVSSSTGSDTNTGSPFAPFKSISRAVRQIQDGDDLLLKRGDTFYESFGAHRWSRVTLGAYGTGPRPLVLTDTSNQTSCFVNLDGQNIRLVGLHLAAAHRDPMQSDFKLVDGTYGIYCMNCNNVLVEDCLIEYFTDNIAIQGTGKTGFHLRRSVIRHAYSASNMFAEGVFLDGQTNVVIEDTVFDTCGWEPALQAEFDRRNKEGASGGVGEGATKTATTQPITVPAIPPSPPLPLPPSTSPPSWITGLQPQPNQPFPGTANIFNHGIYDNVGNGAGPSVVRNCIFVNSSSTGCQQRPGGVIDNCLFIHNGKATDAFTGADQGQITNCVVIGSQQCPPWAAGGGLSLLSRSGKLENNLIIHGSPAQYGPALVIDLPKGQENTATVTDVATIDHNVVYDWPADDLFIFHARPKTQTTNNIFGMTLRQQVDIIDMSNSNYQFVANTYEQSPQQLSFKQKPLTFAAFQQTTGETGKQSSQLQFVDPTRTIESYAKLLGLQPTLADLINASDQQARDHWDIRLTAPMINDYFREGFAVKQ